MGNLAQIAQKKGFEVTSSPSFKDSIAKVSENNFDWKWIYILAISI